MGIGPFNFQSGSDNEKHDRKVGSRCLFLSSSLLSTGWLHGIALRKATVPVGVPFSQSLPLSFPVIVFASFPEVVKQAFSAVPGVALSLFSQKALPTTF